MKASDDVKAGLIVYLVVLGFLLSACGESSVDTAREIKQKDKDMQEIKDLEEKRSEVLLAVEQLQKFKVLHSRHYKMKRGSYLEEPVIELSVINDTSHAVSRVYFKGVVASPNRAVPWIEEKFNYSIPGVIESGEKAEWSLAPNMFSPWGQVKVPNDAKLTVTVERLDGVDGMTLLGINEFGEKEEKRLVELKEKYGM